jgi:hypothetical protein
LPNHAILKGNGTNAIDGVTLTNGQLLIGSTGLAPSAATLTAGTNITITEGAGSITINAAGTTGITWAEVTGDTQAMAVNNGYIANNAADRVVFTLPATAALGSVFHVLGKGAAGWRVAQNADQFLRFGSAVTTTGTDGQLNSSNAFDAVTVVCITANTGFTVMSAVGELDVV